MTSGQCNSFSSSSPKLAGFHDIVFLSFLFPRAQSCWDTNMFLWSFTECSIQSIALLPNVTLLLFILRLTDYSDYTVTFPTNPSNSYHAMSTHSRMLPFTPKFYVSFSSFCDPRPALSLLELCQIHCLQKLEDVRHSQTMEQKDDFIQNPLHYSLPALPLAYYHLL